MQIINISTRNFKKAMLLKFLTAHYGSKQRGKIFSVKKMLYLKGEIKMKKKLKGSLITLTSAVSIICCVMGYYTATLPDAYYVEKGGTLSLASKSFITAEQITESEVQSSADCTYPLTSKSQLKLFGIIPIKEVEIQSVDMPYLVPGGNPFGIKILMDGVMVVETGSVSSGGKTVSPADTAGIETGDIILTVNGESISTNNELQEIISQSDGDTLKIQLTRSEHKISVELEPVYCETEGEYKAGIWVRDSSAGLGTITFFEEESGNFGGLGHPICDVDTGEILPISSGEVVNVEISGVKKGVEGTAGELLGSFTSDKATGYLNLNNSYGVFGKLYESPNDFEAIPMGLKQDIETGYAQIYTTIEGTEPKAYDIEIEKIIYNSDSTSKNMVIRITDEELLEKTGGIIQGMSGSPIIQNGKLIGAVTHVFVNEPSKGYAIFCENMYEFGMTG